MTLVTKNGEMELHSEGGELVVKELKWVGRRLVRFEATLGSALNFGVLLGGTEDLELSETKLKVLSRWERKYEDG